MDSGVGDFGWRACRGPRAGVLKDLGFGGRGRGFVRLTSEQLKQLADAPTLLRETLKSMSPEQRARFDEHLKSLPPAQRAGVERIIAGQAAKFEFRDTGATASFGKWSCRQIDKLVDGQPHESLCVVRTSD